MSNTKRKKVREITVRGVILGVILAVIFTASNIYMGLKIGVTFASSIPAAIISMSIFKLFKNQSILENNIVQTIASVGGTLAAIVLVIPALFISGCWQETPMLEIFFLSAIGSTLGVLYTVPLRRSLVIESKLPYPEGVACANILQLASCEVDEEGYEIIEKKNTKSSNTGKNILYGFFIAVFASIGQDVIKIFSNMMTCVTSIRGGLFSMSAKFSPSLIAAGYLIGSQGAINFIIGYCISAIMIMRLSLIDITTINLIDANNIHFSLIMKLWSEKVRYIGIGFMGVASFWSIIKLLKPLIDGIKSSYQALSHYKEGNKIKRIEKDIPMNYIIFFSLFLLLPILMLFNHFLKEVGINSISLMVLLVILAYVLSFVVSTICGYMAGLVGSSYTPISGIIIIATLIMTTAVITFAKYTNMDIDRETTKSFTALILLSLSFIISVGALANDNLQDLKTGQLVKATPYKQQITLIIGAIIGSMVIGFVIDVLYNAYGFVGAMPREGMDESFALSAPQANLIISVIRGIFSDTLNWEMINTGIFFGIVGIIFSILFGERLEKVHPLAIGMAVYLPPHYVLSIIIGGILAYFVERKAKKDGNKFAKNIGKLFVSGLIIGEALVGVIFAIYIIYSDGNNSIAMNIDPTIQSGSGILIFLFIIFMTWKRAFAKN